MSVDDDSDEDQGEDEVPAIPAQHGPGSNDRVKVFGLEVVEMLKQDHAAKAEVTPLSREMDLETEEVESLVQVEEPEPMLQPGGEDDEVLKMPGSFDLCGPSRVQAPVSGMTWRDLLRRFTN